MINCVQQGIMAQTCTHLRDLLRKSCCIFLMSDVFVIRGDLAAEHTP